jgi:hypothetical protein
MRVFVDSEGQTIWVADAHRDDGKRFVVRADEMLNCVFGTRICDSHGPLAVSRSDWLRDLCVRPNGYFGFVGTGVAVGRSPSCRIMPISSRVA